MYFSSKANHAYKAHGPITQSFQFRKALITRIHAMVIPSPDNISQADVHMKHPCRFWIHFFFNWLIQTDPITAYHKVFHRIPKTFTQKHTLKSITTQRKHALAHKGVSSTQGSFFKPTRTGWSAGKDWQAEHWWQGELVGVCCLWVKKINGIEGRTCSG